MTAMRRIAAIPSVPVHSSASDAAHFCKCAKRYLSGKSEKQNCKRGDALRFGRVSLSEYLENLSKEKCVPSV